MASTAAFTISASPSVDPTTGDRGYEGSSGETLTLQLEDNPATDVQRTTFAVNDAAVPSSPVKSEDAPVITFTGSGTASEEAATPISTVDIDLPVTTTAQSYEIRCTINTAAGTQTFTRTVSIRNSLNLRKLAPAEQNQFHAKGWSQTQNEMVDEIATVASTGTSTKVPARIASTIDLGLTGLAAIDGVTPIAGDRILAKNQADGTENGVYLAAAGAWSRATDFDDDAEVFSGVQVYVEEGTANATKVFFLSTVNPITVGVTALVFIVSTVGSLTDVLGVGNITGGTDLDVTVGDNIDYLGEVSVQRQGTDVLTTPGVGVAHIHGAAGAVVAAFSSTTPSAGIPGMFATGGTVSGVGIAIESEDGISGAGDGGQMDFVTGAAFATGDGAGGDWQVQIGAGDGAGAGGDGSIAGGLGGVTGDGSTLTIEAGGSSNNAADSGDGAFFDLEGGQHNAGAPITGGASLGSGALNGTSNGTVGDTRIFVGTIASATGTKVAGNILFDLENTNADTPGAVQFRANSIPLLRWVAATPVVGVPGFVTTGGTVAGTSLAIETEAGVSGAGAGGNFSILAGNAFATSDAAGGSIQGIAGNGDLTTGGGTTSWTGGIGGATGGGGDSFIEGGAGSNEAATHAQGAQIFAGGGAHGGGTPVGGAAQVSAGDVSGDGNAIAGSVFLFSGAIASATGTKTAGSIVLDLKNANADTPGVIEFRQDTTPFVTFDPDAATANFTSLDIITSTGSFIAGADPSTDTAAVLRVDNAVVAVSARNQADDGDLDLIGSDASDNTTVGDVSGTIPITTSATVVEIGVATIQFGFAVVTPIFQQETDSGDDATGDLMTIHAQDVSGGGTTITGAGLLVRAGNASGAATNDIGGVLTLGGGTGTTTDGAVLVQVGGSDYLTAGSIAAGVVGVHVAIFGFDQSVVAPVIVQGDLTTSGTGQLMRIHAQASTTAGTNNIGGALDVFAGDATNGTGTNVGGAGTYGSGDATTAGTTNTGGKTTARAGNASGGTTNIGGDYALLWGTGAEQTGNITIGTDNTSWDAMEGGLFIGDVVTSPTGDPASGGYLYVESGALMWRGSSGTITPIAAA